MATKQYIGSRYVPIFADPIEWDKTLTYEPLTIVIHQGSSYTSRQYVPSGVDITDDTYWALTGNYNAQVEQYRREVASKLDTVAHDDTLKGSGTKKDPITINLNHTNQMRDGGNTVYPALMYTEQMQGTGTQRTPRGIGFNAGTGLTSYNSDDPNVGSGIKLSDQTNTDIATCKNTSDYVQTRRKRNFVLLGDSWTVVHNNALYNELKRLNPSSKWYNYGINGAVVQQLPEMVSSARSDATLRPDEITDVIIVMGTNNVFWRNLGGYADIMPSPAYNAFKAVRDYFPDATIRYFPNNSKTLNEGRNALYRNIIDGALSANIGVIPESLYLLAAHINWFNGNDQEGVQHLSDSGYVKFAQWINNILHGGSPFHSTQYLEFLTINDYTSPTDDSSIDNDTLIIKDVTANKTVGYLKNAVMQVAYYANETIDLEIIGNLTLMDGATTSVNALYLTCVNWNQKIAKHTLPYVILGSLCVGYPQFKAFTGLSSDWVGSFQSASSNVSTANGIYIRMPALQSVDNGRRIDLAFRNVRTSAVNFEAQ